MFHQRLLLPQQSAAQCRDFQTEIAAEIEGESRVSSGFLHVDVSTDEPLTAVMAVLSKQRRRFVSPLPTLLYLLVMDRRTVSIPLRVFSLVHLGCFPLPWLPVGGKMAVPDSSVSARQQPGWCQVTCSERRGHIDIKVFVAKDLFDLNESFSNN